MTDVPTSRGITAAVCITAVSIVASVILVVTAVAVRLVLGTSGVWAEVALIGGTLALAVAGTWWLAGRVVRRGD